MKTAYVYAIKNRRTGKLYVGSTRELDVRWANHRGLLAQGLHSPKMQAAWDESTPDDWEWIVLEEGIPLIHQFASEQHWIDALEAYRAGLNSNPRAGTYVTIDSRGYDSFVKQREEEIRQMLVLISERKLYRDIARQYGVSIGFLAKLKAANRELLADLIAQEQRETLEASTRKQSAKERRGQRAGNREEIIRMLKLGRTYREISASVGCALGTVANVAKSLRDEATSEPVGKVPDSSVGDV
jgi:uncharacterized protein YerC